MTDEDRKLLLEVLETARRAEAAALRAAENTSEMMDLLTEDDPDLLDEPQRTLEGEDAGAQRDGSRSLDE